MPLCPTCVGQHQGSAPRGWGDGERSGGGGGGFVAPEVAAQPQPCSCERSLPAAPKSLPRLPPSSLEKGQPSPVVLSASASQRLFVCTVFCPFGRSYGTIWVRAGME